MNYSVLRQAILTGSCAVALASAVTPSVSLAADFTLSVPAIWASAGGDNSTNLANASDGDNVDVDTYILTVTNDGAADDGSGNTNTFALGAVTDTPPGGETTGGVVVVQGTQNALAATITSVDVDGDVEVKSISGSGGQGVTATVAGSVVAKDILVTNASTNVTDTVVSLTVEGHLTASGSTTIDSGNTDGDTARLILNSGSTQNVAGPISGTSGGNGEFIDVKNSSAAGVIFDDAITLMDTISVAGDGTLNSSATFKGNVTTTGGIILGNTGGTDTNTVTFDATSGVLTVTGIVDGVSSGTDTNNVVIKGDSSNKVIAADNWGATTDLNKVDIEATGILEVATGKTITSDVNFTGDGTVDLLLTAGITGAINNTTGSDGAGTLTSTIATGGTTTLANAIGGTNSLKAVTLKGAGTLAFSDDVAATTISTTAAGTLDFDGDVTGNVSLFAGSTADFDGDVTGNVSLTTSSTADLAASKDITGTVDGPGVLTLGGDNTVSGTVGAGTALTSIAVSGTGTSSFTSDVAATTISTTAAGTLDFNGDVTGNVSLFAGSTADFDGDVTGNVTLTTSSTADLAASKDITGTVDGPGVLTLGGGNTVSGTVGAGTALTSIAVSGTGTSSFTSDVAATTISTTAAGTLDFNGDVTGNVSLFAGSTADFDGDVTGNVTLTTSSTADLAASKDITGTVDGPGVLTLGGGNTVSGTVGAGTALTSIAVSGTGTSSFTSDVAATTISTTAAGTLDFNGDVTGNVSLFAGSTADLAASKNITGNVDGGGALTLGGGNTVTGTVGAGTELTSITVTGAGNTTFSGAIKNGAAAGAGTLVTAADSILYFSDDAKFSGVATNLGIVNIALGKTLTVASFTTGGTAGTYILNVGDVGGALGASKIEITGNVNAALDDDITISFVIGDDVSNGTVLNVIKKGAFATQDAYDVTTFLQTFKFIKSVNDVNLIVAPNGTNSMATALSGNGTAAVNAALQGGPASVYKTAYKTAINNATTASAVNAIAESYQPATTANTAASVGAILNAASTNNARIESQTVALRGGSNKYALNQSVTGVATGEASKNLQGWGQVFGQHVNQGDRDGQSGYTANSYGIVLGFDTAMVNDSLLGVALTYSRTKVDAGNSSNTTINNYQFSAYGQYDITETNYVRGQAGYARGKNHVTSSTLGDADYSSNQFLVQAELGHNFEVTKNYTVTPSIGNYFIHYRADSYSQAGGTVSPDSMNIYEITSKLAVSYNHDLGQGSFLQPTAYFGYNYDILGAKASSSSSVGGSAVFETPGVEPARGTIIAGVGILYTLAESVDLYANIDYQHKSAFNSYGGSLKAAYRF